MKFIKRISIRHQLMFLAGFVALGMIGLAMISHLTNSQVRELAEARLTIAKIDSAMLTLRRNEKDFMARKDAKYVGKFAANFGNMMTEVDRLQLLLENQGADTAEIAQLKQVFQQYQATFFKVAETVEKIGLDHKSGLYGALRKAVHNAASILKEQDQIQFTADMLMLRRRAKDFMLRYDPKYLDKYNKDFAVFEQHLDYSNLDADTAARVTSTMATYKTNFTALVEGQKTLGLSSTEGLYGEMRTTAHQSETLHSIIDAVSRIKDMNLSIATASEQQATVSSEINNSVKNINEVTSETAKNSQLTMQAGKSLNSISTDMNNLFKDFKVD